MQLHPIEKALLTSAWDASIPVTAAADLVKLAVDADFGAVLTGPDARRVLQVAETSDPKALDRLISLSPPKNKEEELVLVALAVAALHAFLQANWTGPDLAFTAEDVLNSSVPASTLNALAVSELALGGEPAYHLCASPFLLRLAQLLLELPFAHTPSVPWWRLRLANVHLQILDEAVPPPPALLAELAELRAHLPAIDTDLAGALLLEEGLLQHRLGDDKAAAPLFVRAARATGLEYELTGALGKRTKFQQFDITQLVLLAESRKRAGDSKPEGEASEEADKAPAPTPETLALNDDTLLERTQFTSSSAGPGTSTAGTARLAHIDPNAQPALHPLDTAILLALCLNVRNTSPADGLTGEQMAPYVARALSHARNWSVHTLALLLRTRLEAHRTRTVERAVLQLQALVDQMPSADASVPERLRLLHALALPSKWELERELATRLLSLGVVRSALEIFERLEMWEEAVGCHQALGGKDTGVVIVRDLLTGGRTEAAAVLRREKDALEGEPDAKRAARTRTLDVAREAKLWCLLGDLEPERAREHYAHAWELSGHTSGRAVRSLGGLHFTAGRFAEAIPCLRAALAINPLLSRSWFVLGCACTREEDWAGARDAFTRCVAIDDTDAESWNNLASAYLRLSAEESKVADGDGEGAAPAAEEVDAPAAVPFAHKTLAFRALQHGLRFGYDNWRMWANLAVVATDVGELAEATRAVGRVVEERAAKDGAAAVDLGVLARLVDAAVRDPGAEDTIRGDPNAGAPLYRRVLDLVERTILPRVSGEPAVFRAYARLLLARGRWADALQAHTDAYRCSAVARFVPDEHDVRGFVDAAAEVVELVEVLRNFGPRADPGDDGRRWKAQARSVLRTFMGRSREAFGEESAWAGLEELMTELKAEIE